MGDAARESRGARLRATPWLLTVLGLVLVACASGNTLTADDLPRRIFQVGDFGAVPDSPADAGPGIRAALQAATAAAPGSEVVFGAGTYRVKPPAPREACFALHQATNLVIRGAGQNTKILINDPASGGFTFTACEQVTLRDLVLDYDPVPFCQGVIRAVDESAGSFELEVDPGYPTPDAGNFLKAVEPYGKWGMILDPATRRIRAGTPDHFLTPRWEACGGRTWRFFTEGEHYRRSLRHMRPGDAYVHLARGHGSAVLAQNCNGVRIENVRVHASPGLVVGLVGNQGELRVSGLEVRFAPGTTRLLTANADGVHCQQNRSGPIIEDCYFEGMADDAINIYAPPGIVREIRSPIRWLVSSGPLFRRGDRLQVFDPRSGRVRGEVKVADARVEPGGLLVDVDRAVDGLVAGADHRTADTLYNLDGCGAGFLIRRNHMNGNRRYGCLLRAGGGVVEDNTFEDTTGAGVVLTNEPDWPEGPVPWNVSLRRNRFVRGGTCLGYADSPEGAALVVRATKLGHGLADAEALREVMIEENQIEDRAGTSVFVGGANQVTLKSNRFSAAPGTSHRPAGPVILLERSSRVRLRDNTITDARPETLAAVEIGAQVAPGEAGVQVDALNAQLSPSAKTLIDRRPAK